MAEPKEVLTPAEKANVEQIADFRDQLLSWRNQAIWEWAVKNTIILERDTSRPKRQFIDLKDLKEFLGV